MADKENLIVEPETSFVEPQGDSEEAKEQRAQLWTTRLSEAKNVQKPMQAKWEDWYKMMYAATNTEKMALWKSKAFLPIIAGKVWDLVSRFVQYKPSWAVKLYNLPVSMDTEALTVYLQEINTTYDKIKMKMDYDYDDPVRRVPIQDEFFSVLIDAIVTGTGLARVTYELAEEVEREHAFDPLTDNVDVTLENVTNIQRGFNNFEAVNIYNLYISPSAKDLQTADWIMVRDTVSKSELLSHPEYDQEVISKMKFGVVNDDTAVYQFAKNRFANTQDPEAADSKEKKCWCYDCWDGESGMHTIYIGGNDGQLVEVYREENPYWHGKYPYVPFRIRRKPHLFWGESFFENSETLQSAINDLFNHYMDSYNMADGMLAIEEGSIVEPYMIEPGGEFRYRGEKPTQLRFPEPNPAQLTTIMGQINQVIESVTISQYASGVPNSATDTTQGTATGVTRLMEAATEKIGMMRQNVRRSWAEVGNMWLVNSQQFMVDPVVYERETAQGNIAEMITPSDIRGNFVLRVDENSFEPISADQMRENYIQYVANLEAWAKSSREQAAANGTKEGIVSIDYLHAIQRLSELSSENSSSIILPANNDSLLENPEQPAPEAMPQETAPPMDMPPELNQNGVIEPPQGLNAGTETPDMFYTEEATRPANDLGLRNMKRNTIRTINGVPGMV